VDAAAQGFFDSGIIDFGQLMIQTLKPWPLLLPKDKHKSRKVKAGMVAYVFVLAGFGSIYIEIDYLRINIISLLKRSNERANVLKGGASNEFGGGVFEESVVDVT
jgi:hypothetical protein